MTGIPLSPAAFEALRTLDGCTVANAIETFGLRLRDEGFVHGAVLCHLPQLPPMLGYAVTGRIRTIPAPVTGQCYHDRMDFWRHFKTIPSPRVIVMQDLDSVPGKGALVGEIHAEIARALGGVGYVTNGAVRDLTVVKAMGFHLFAGSLSVSHAYAHIVDFGEAVEIGGLTIHPGDLVHGDRHGVQTIPAHIATEIPGVSAEMVARERELIDFCRSPAFSLETLAERFNLRG